MILLVVMTIVHLTLSVLVSFLVHWKKKILSLKRSLIGIGETELQRQSAFIKKQIRLVINYSTSVTTNYAIMKVKFKNKRLEQESANLTTNRMCKRIRI